MMILYAIISAVTVVGVILLRHYLEERKKRPRNDKFCYNCNLNFPNNYTACPKCGLGFGR